MSFMNIVRKSSVLSIVSIGMTMVILSGGLDLSVGSSIAFAGAVSAVILNSTGNAFLGYIVAIGIAASVGLINGLLIGKVKLNPVIVTLAMMGIARTGSLVVTGASPISIDNDIFKWIGQAGIGKGLSAIPMVLFLVVLVYVCFEQILKKTLFGRNLYALGGNEHAARVSGIKTTTYTVAVYTITGVLVGIGSIILVGRSSAAIPLAGLGLEFEAVTAVILGGTALTGGKGDLLGTFLGVVLLGILFNGFALMDITPYIQTLIKGLLLLGAVLLNEKLGKRET
jgi:ribose transport system permease protein